MRRWQDFASRAAKARQGLDQWMADHRPGAGPIIADLRAGATPESLGVVDAETSIQAIAAANRAARVERPRTTADGTGEVHPSA